MTVRLVIFVIVCLVVLFILSTQTMIFQKKSDSDILKKEFSKHQDIWIKEENNKNLLILLHGMYSHPAFYEEVGQKIAQHGWDVFIPVLPNASLTPEELSEQEPYQWEDLLKVAFQRSLIYNQNYDKVVLAGHSQGGSLALTIAPSLPFLNGLIIVASPVDLINRQYKFWKNTSIVFSGMLSWILPKKGLFLKKSNYQEKSDIENQQYEREFIFGLTLHSMNLGLKKTRKHLDQIFVPTLLVYEKGDRVVSLWNYEYIKNNIGSKVLKEKIFDTPLDLEPYSNRHRLFNYIYTKDLLAEEMIEFLSSL